MKFIYLLQQLAITMMLFLFSTSMVYSQGPEITSWLQNTTKTGSFYVSGNSTAMDNGILYNCQLIEYSDDFVYVHTNGIPAYPTGPFLDGNQSQAESQDAIFQIPRNPVENLGEKNTTTGGNIGIFINGVALFDYRDGVGWNSQTNELCGGPRNERCPRVGTDWNRDAVPAEMRGFDCSKAHPAGGNYHHHQNPSAFDLDLEVVSNVCNLYDADGLYAIDSNSHSPLIGYAYDGFPIYGAFGYKNADGSGGIERIKSGYELRDITERKTHADGTVVGEGPDISAEYFLGYFREDYGFIEHGTDDYLDIHNGRFCVTPEYPAGTYAYFATVDKNWNSAYPYVVGPTFYGASDRRSVEAVNEETTVFMTTKNTDLLVSQHSVTVFPNPSSDLIAVQINGLVKNDLEVTLVNNVGQKVSSKIIKSGSTIAYFDTRSLYNGVYSVVIGNGHKDQVIKVVVQR